jgi:two-component system response regulator AtoC
VLAIDTGSDNRLREMKSVSLYGIRSVLCVPLRSRGKIVGAVYLDSRAHGAAFDAEDLQFLEAFADHAALALENVRARRRLEQQNRRLQVVAESRSRLGDIRGASQAMQGVYELVLKYAESNLPVLILGESGTGKELAARAIHGHGSRKRAEFVSENCAAIPESLLESELFGHVKGAFTGAERDRAGLFETADGGTLFLDEVGDMPATMQARLLRALQEREVRRVGADHAVAVDVRVLAATNRVLADEVAAGRFREDLFYRLQVLVLNLPPLRERHGDVPLLVEHFLRRISEERGVAPPQIRQQVLDVLERYSWPGNVRQLENVVQRLSLLAGEGAITLDVVQSDRGLRESLLTDAPAGGGAVLSLARNERDRIREALDATSGNRTRAAKLLGISRATIFRKIKEYELDR